MVNILRINLSLSFEKEKKKEKIMKLVCVNDLHVNKYN